MSTLCRLTREEGRVEVFSATLLEAPCDALGVESAVVEGVSA